MLKKLLLTLVCATIMSTFFLSHSYAKTVETSPSTLAILDDQAANKKNNNSKSSTSTNKTSTSGGLFAPLKEAFHTVSQTVQAVAERASNSSHNNSPLNEKEDYCMNTLHLSGINLSACVSCWDVRNITGIYSNCVENYKKDHANTDNTTGTGDTNAGSNTGSNNGGSDGNGQTSGNSSSNITNSDGANTGAPDEEAENHYADITQPDIVFEGRTDETFLGLVSWDSGIDKINDQKSLISGIWTIAANVLVDITVIASYLVLAYVIYGGYLYTFSTGEAGKVELGKKTLTRAFIGLAIVLLANIIMNSIRFALLGASGKPTDCATSECINPTTAIASAINWVIGIAGVVSVVFVIYGGIMYITSAGDAGKVEKAKKTIIYSLIGLVIVALSVIISSFVSSTIMNSKKSSFINNYQETISKEVNEIEVL